MAFGLHLLSCVVDLKPYLLTALVEHSPRGQSVVGLNSTCGSSFLGKKSCRVVNVLFELPSP